MMLRIFVGYDSRETLAYHVLVHSILRHTKVPVSITPLKLDQLAMYSRPRGSTEATEFSMTRFLVPYLCEFEGQAIFMDCDMLARADLTELWAKAFTQPDKAVFVCKHDYVPKDAVKMDGQQQTAYPRKNWSSLIVFNAAKCRALTPEYVNAASGLQLHRFQWISDDGSVRSDSSGNWLVGEYPPNRAAKLLHYTLGGPWVCQLQGLRSRTGVARGVRPPVRVRASA